MNRLRLSFTVRRCPPPRRSSWPPWLAAAIAALLTFTGRPVDAATAHNPYEARLEALRVRGAQRRGRPEAIAVVAAAMRLDDRVMPAALRGLLRPIADEPSADPLVAAQAAFQLAALDDGDGDSTAAADRRRSLGLLDDAWVMGPFDAQGRSGLDSSLPPEAGETDVGAGRKFPGKEREVSWRRATGAFASGALLLDALMRPERDALAYVLVNARSDRARTVALRLGSSGPIKAWVNGVAVLERDALRPARFDQDAVAVTLRAGDNVVLLKSISGDAGWRVLARLTELDGRASKGVAWSRDPPLPSTAAGTPARRIPPARSLTPVLRERAEAKGGRDAALWLDLAEWLALTAPDDAEDRTAERAARRAAELGQGSVKAEALLLLGELARQDDDRREALEAAVPLLNPAERALAITAGGELARAARRDAAAFAAWREALALDPHCWPAVLAVAVEEQAVGMPFAAWRRIQALPADVRELPRVRRTEARLLEALGRPREALALLEGFVTNRRTDVEVLQTLAGLARTLKGPQEGARYLRDLAVARPDLTFAPLELARLLEGAGQRDEARRVLAATAERLPDEPRLAEELGKLLARADRPAEALVWLRRALDLRPQNPTLRRYTERLARAVAGGNAEHDAAADLARQHAEDVVPMARAALVAAGDRARADVAAGDPAIVLLDRRVVRVHENGLSDVFAQRVVEVRTEAGARSLNRFFVRYTPGDQEVEIRRARILRRGPSGDLSPIEATGRQDQDLSEPWYGLYYDNRAVVVEFDGLQPGDVLELQYTVSDTASRNQLGGYFGDFQFIAETLPTRRWEYTLLAPKRRAFHFHVPALNGRGTLARDDANIGSERRTRFVARNVPRIETEPSMPGLAEVAPYLHVSTFASWDEVGRWYWQLVRDQLIPDDAVRRAAAEATAGAKTDLDKVRAVHRLVVSGTRYVGLEFGIHGYKPYRVGQVLARRFGDCKDKASLLVALLREVGVESQLVLVRTRRGGRVSPQPASLAVFDHAIAYVPQLDLFLDGTAEFSGMDELPSQDQGVMVLRVDARGAQLVETPVLPSSSNRAARRWKVALSADGSARVDESLTITGQAAPDWRQHYEAVGERLDRYAKVWNGRLPGTRVERVDMEGLDDRNRAVELQASLHVPRFAETSPDGRIELPVAARDAEFVRAYARLSDRKQELLLSFPWQHEETLEVELPPGLRASRLPAPRDERSPFGRFSFEASASPDGRHVRIRTSLDVTRHRISPADYGAFRRFLGAVDATLSEHVELAKEKP